MNEVKPLTPPQEGKTDKALALAKAVLGDIIPFGGTFAELAGQFIRTPYQKRAEEWQTQLGEALHRLEGELKRLSDSQARTLEDLQADPAFVDTVLHASQVALCTASEDKRTALRNAVINSGLPLAPDESQRQMFLNMIESFTPWHLRMLALFNDPICWFRTRGKAWPNIYMGARTHILEAAYPETKQNEEFFRQVWRDLYSAGLVATDSLSGMMTENGLKQPATIATGRRFFLFISEPPSTP